MPTISEILDTTAESIEHGKWGRGTYLNPKTGARCAVGHVAQVLGIHGARAAGHPAVVELNRQVRDETNRSNIGILTYNDSMVGHDKRKVARLVRRAARRVRREEALARVEIVAGV